MAAWRKFLTEHPIPKGKGKKGDVKPDKKVAAELRTGKRRAFVYANRADDIERALAFIDEAELDAVLVDVSRVTWSRKPSRTQDSV